MRFVGGETAALARLQDYFWAKLKKYEEERVANQSTYWVLFELLWRDYFRFLSIKYGNSIFHLGGPRNVKGLRWGQDQVLFEAWRDGKTGYPLIDANMKELAATGFMSNRGRQIVCSFLVRDMGLDWRLGAECTAGRERSPRRSIFQHPETGPDLRRGWRICRPLASSAENASESSST